MRSGIGRGCLGRFPSGREEHVINGADEALHGSAEHTDKGHEHNDHVVHVHSVVIDIGVHEDREGWHFAVPSY